MNQSFRPGAEAQLKAYRTVTDQVTIAETWLTPILDRDEKVFSDPQSVYVAIDRAIEALQIAKIKHAAVYYPPRGDLPVNNELASQPLIKQ